MEKVHYTQKLDKLGVIDNLFVPEMNIVGEDLDCWSSVEYPDIYNYLIQTPSPYTDESLTACINGWIDKVKVVCIMQLEEHH